MREKRKREIERNREKWLKLFEVVLNETIKFKLNGITEKKNIFRFKKSTNEETLKIQNQEEGVLKRFFF